MTEHGTVLAGRYELDQIIGRGGMAEVWRARDRRLNRDVAVKRLRIDLASDPTFQARFRREAQSSAGLNHPNIVAVYDTGEEKDTNSDVSVPYIVMELIEGITLRDVLRDGRRILPQRALEFTKGILDALAYSHRAGIVHRDIKPANVMLTPAGTVKVMDFGIARAVADTSATMTQTAAVIGTAQYLSPEQARGERVDNRSDIYSVGCLLYELLVSQPPFKGDSPVSVAYQHVREMPVPPSQLDPEITPDMDAIVLKALAKDPAHRYQDAQEFATDVQRAINRQPVLAQSPTAIPVEEPTAVLAGAVPTAKRAAAPAPVAANTEPEPKKKSKAGVIVLSSLAGLLLVGIIVAIWIVMNPPKPTVQQVTVPNLFGWTQADAEAELAKEQLVPKVEPIAGTAQDKGTVVRQDPAGSQVVNVGATVTLFVSQGPTMNKIPDNIVGTTEEQAKAALKAAGFTNVFSTPADPRTEPITAKAGDVTAINPPAGAEIAPDAQITLTVATGRSVVPSLRTLTTAEAQTAAQTAGFTVRIVNEETATQQAGLVFDQSPPPGQEMARTEPIVIKVAVAPPPPATTTQAPPTTKPPTTPPPTSTPPETTPASTETAHP